jgi:hypothetical protein
MINKFKAKVYSRNAKLRCAEKRGRCVDAQKSTAGD